MKGNDIMGKKDEEIARLKAENEKFMNVFKTKEKLVVEQQAMISSQLDELNEAQAKNKGLTEQNQRLGNKLDSDREAYAERAKQLEVDSKKVLADMRVEFEHLDNVKQVLDLEVNVSGLNADDIPTTLDKAVVLMKDRLKELDLADKYNILAHPQTLKLKLLE